MIKKRVFAPLIASLLLIGGIAIAEQPAQNVSKGKHPNLAAAQRLSNQAFEKITAAQQANEWDMQGHAKKAKDLLEQANNELKQAAQSANKNAK
jgi:hypothetical protein